MSDNRSTEEMKQKYIDCMGEDLGKQYHALWQELSWLYLKWSEYVELYGTKPSRIELLNNAAPSFFRLVQDALWENTLLHLARLTDPPSSGRDKENLTIKRLPQLIPDVEKAQEVLELVKIADNSTEFARDWRNRRIAHRDLKLAIKDSVTPLELASREKVKKALKSISDVLNAVEMHYTETTVCYDLVVGASGRAGLLLQVLYDGLKAGIERDDRIARGECRDDDFSIVDL